MPLKTTQKHTTTKPQPKNKPSQQAFIQKIKQDDKSAMKLAHKYLFDNDEGAKEIDEFKALMSHDKISAYSPLTFSQFLKEVSFFDSSRNTTLERTWTAKEFIAWNKKWNGSLGSSSIFIPLFNKEPHITSKMKTYDKGEILSFYPTKHVQQAIKFHKINPIKRVVFAPTQPIIIVHEKGLTFIAPHYYTEDDMSEIPTEGSRYNGIRKLITMVENEELEKIFKEHPSVLKALDFASTETKLSRIDKAVDLEHMQLEEWYNQPLVADIKNIDNRNVKKLEKEVRKMPTDSFLEVYRFFIPENDHVVRKGDIELDEKRKPYYKIKNNKIDIPLSTVLIKELFKRLYESDTEKFQQHKNLIEKQIIDLKEDSSGEAKDTIVVFNRTLKEVKKWNKSNVLDFNSKSKEKEVKPKMSLKKAKEVQLREINRQLEQVYQLEKNLPKHLHTYKQTTQLIKRLEKQKEELEG